MPDLNVDLIRECRLASLAAEHSLYVCFVTVESLREYKSTQLALFPFDYTKQCARGKT
jgi:hypothetical protein